MTFLLEQKSILNEICKKNMVLDKDDIEVFFQSSDWVQRLDIQLALQEQILLSRDVDAAIAVLSHCEFYSGLALDFDILMRMVVLYADADQALTALKNIFQSHAVDLQRNILKKGSHEHIAQLKQWQASPTKTEKEGLI